MHIRKGMCRILMNLCWCRMPRWDRGISNPFIYTSWKDASLRRRTMKGPRRYSSWIRRRRGATGQGRIRWERGSGFGGAFSRVVAVARNSPHTSVNESPEPMVYMSYFQHPGDETMVQVKTEGNPVDLEPM